MKPDVLLLKAILPDKIRALEVRVTPHRLDQPADRDAFLAAVGRDIRAVVVGGQAPATQALFAQLLHLETVANFGVGYDTIDVILTPCRPSSLPAETSAWSEEADLCAAVTTSGGCATLGTVDVSSFPGWA